MDFTRLPDISGSLTFRSKDSFWYDFWRIYYFGRNGVTPVYQGAGTWIFNDLGSDMVLPMHPLYSIAAFWDYVNQVNTWITADRREIKIEEIETDHLENIITWAKQREDQFKRTFRAAREEDRIPEGTYIYKLSDFPLFKRINEEAQNRGLSNVI